MRFIVRSFPALIFLLFATGCASQPWKGKFRDDWRVKEFCNNENMLQLKLAVAPVKIPTVEEQENNGTSERHSMIVEHERVQAQITEALTNSGIFSEINPLNAAQPDCTLEDLMKLAWEKDSDLILTLDFKNFNAFYDGVNAWYIPNLFNWLFLLVPSWWVKDEVYGSAVTVDMALKSVRSGNLLYQKEFDIQFKRSLNDFQRGWQLFGIFRVPGSLGGSNWRRISDRLMPGILREIQVQTVLSLHKEFRPIVEKPEFREKLDTKLGLVIGISRHKDYNITKLKYAEEDALSVFNYLTEPSEGAIPKRNVKLLTNEHASKAEILKNLDYLAARTRPQDSVVLYFAGYAMTSLDLEEDEGIADQPVPCIVPYDADRDNLVNSSITLNEIEEKLTSIQAREILVILDTSFSADTESRSLTKETRQVAIFEKLLEQSGRYLLMSGKAGEGAMEVDDHRHGVFTFYLLEGLKGAADSDKDEILTLGELHEYLLGKVAEETQMEGSAQHPVLHGEGAKDMPLNK